MSRMLAVEIDPYEFSVDAVDTLPSKAKWRKDMSAEAAAEFVGGRSYRKPKNAIYAAVEWTGYSAEIGKLLEWVETTPGITRYSEIPEIP